MQVTPVNVKGIFSYSERIGISHAYKCGDTIHISGQVAIDPDGKLVGRGDGAAQAEYIFENIKRVLAEAGATLNDVVKYFIYYTHPEDFSWITMVRRRYFSREPYPCGTSVCVQALAMPGLLVEIDVIAIIRG